MVPTAGVLSLNWIHLKIISAATFRIIGLTKIEFLLLDWIYRSIRIMTVSKMGNWLLDCCVEEARRKGQSSSTFDL